MPIASRKGAKWLAVVASLLWLFGAIAFISDLLAWFQARRGRRHADVSEKKEDDL